MKHSADAGRCTPMAANGVTLFDWLNRAPELVLRSTLHTLRANTSAQWASLTPLLFVDNVSSTSVYRHPRDTVSDAVLRSLATDAINAGMRVLIKPHLLVRCALHGGGCAVGRPCRVMRKRGPAPAKCTRLNLGCNAGEEWRSAEWSQFFESYAAQVAQYARLAKAVGASAFCVATELSCAVAAAPSPLWRRLV